MVPDHGFEAIDYLGRTIRLDHANWERHRSRRPEVVPYHDKIPQVLLEPNVVVESAGSRYYYRRGIGAGKFEGVYLKVVVGSIDGVIRTAHFTRTIDQNGDIVHVQNRR
ncbi:MAG: hypothetical protein QOF51_703 [Chloroflexota bacterium]|nr:hypothetical protein [Chloroflexota bacterium]